MVVAFTTNLGLAKPDDSELALNWTRSQKLLEDNNLIIAPAADIVLQSFVPAMVAATTLPNVGAGSILTEYSIVQGYCFGQFVVKFIDPGVLPGTGAGSYGIQLPALADTTFHTAATALTDAPGTASCIGEGYMEDNSSVANSGTVALELLTYGGFSHVRPITEAYAGKTVRWMGPTFPFTIATGDSFTGNFFYKLAP